MSDATPFVGRAAGVPFVAKPPFTWSHEAAPIVVAWHLMDPPRTEAAMAAALPLEGLDAWRVYLGLPMSGSRLPAGGVDEIMRLGTEDAVLNLYDPIITGAAAEFPAALADLRQQLGMRSAIVGLLGGSAGAAVAQLIMAEGDMDVGAAVLVSPLVQLRPTVAAVGRYFGVDYSWTNASNRVADRLDFVARASEIAERQHEPPIMMIVGDADDAEFLESARAMHAELDRVYADPDRVRLVTIGGMPHALADEPGIDPAPQNANAAEVDVFAVQWLREHLDALPTTA